MFFSQDAPKTIYSGNKTVSPESLLEAMNSAQETLDNAANDIVIQYVEHAKRKLIDQHKSPEEIEQCTSSPRFTEEASVYASNMLSIKIADYLCSNSQLGESKTKILTRRLKSLEHKRRNLILQGMYKLSLLAEFNKVMQDASEEEFQTLIEVIIACGHLEEDIPVPEQQQQLKETIESHAREGTDLLSLQTMSDALESFTGIDMRNPIGSLKKKLNFGKKESEKQILSSIDEMTLDTVISIPTQCTYILLGAISFGMSSLAGAVLPLALIGIIGKGAYGLITEDKNKEGTVHNPLSEKIVSQPVIRDQQQNYSAILQRQKEESEQNTPTGKQL